jgi:REP element-mobilizing transposase RayT
MQLSRLGEIVQRHWQNIPEHHGPRVALDEFVVMPNHLHGIILLLSASQFPDAPAVKPLGTIAGG